MLTLRDQLALLSRPHMRATASVVLTFAAVLFVTAATPLGCAEEAPAPAGPTDTADLGDATSSSNCTCGDGTCSASCYENKVTCPVDCKACGDGICSPAEGPIACPIDCCGGCGDGKCRGYDCGEDPGKCPQDCGTACGNKTCDKGETPQSCAEDCKWQVCGNGTCEPTDLGPYECPQDCGPTCGNCTCEKGEDFIACPGDCGYCGDNVCSLCTQLGENPTTCANDCNAPAGWDAGSIEPATDGGSTVGELDTGPVVAPDAGPAGAGCSNPVEFEAGVFGSAATVEGTWNGNSFVAADAVAVTTQMKGDGTYSATLTIRITPYANACGHELSWLNPAGMFLELSVTVRSDTALPSVPMQIGKVDVWPGIDLPKVDTPYASLSRRYIGSAEGYTCSGGGGMQPQCGNGFCEWGSETPATCPADCVLGGSVTITEVGKAAGKDVITGSFTYTESKSVSVTGTFKAPICNYDKESGQKHCCLPAPAAAD